MPFEQLFFCLLEHGEGRLFLAAMALFLRFKLNILYVYCIYNISSFPTCTKKEYWHDIIIG